MWVHSIMLSLLLVTGAPVEVTRLDGTRLTGELHLLNTTSLQLSGPEGILDLPVTELQGIELGTSSGSPAPMQVRLTDDSLLTGESVSVAEGTLSLTSQELGSVELPSRQVHSALLVAIDDKTSSAWDEMRKKTSQSDLLVIRKGENLDFVGGTIGAVDEASVTLISRGREVKVPREKVVGIVYATHPMTPGNPTCEVTTVNGSRLRVQTVELKEGQAILALAGRPTIQIPAQQLKSLDFALGRIVSLFKALSNQQLPAGVSESVVAVRSHAFSSSTLQKVPLLVGGTSYSDGLLVHPQTKLEFTLNRQFRRFRSVVGIDENASERTRFEPVVHVEILTDGKQIWEKEVRWDAPPESVDLDLTGAKVLEIVTSTTDGKLGPLRHLDFADAKLIK